MPPTKTKRQNHKFLSELDERLDSPPLDFLPEQDNLVESLKSEFSLSDDGMFSIKQE